MALRPRWHKVLSDLWKNKSRSILTILSISVGLLAFGVVANIYFLINQDMSNGYFNVNPPNIQLQTSLLNQDMINHLEKMEGVKTAEGARETSMQILTVAGNFDAIDIQSKDYSQSEIGTVTLVKGSWPPQKNQIVLSNHKIKNLQAEIGDWVVLQDSSGEEYKLQVVGIVKDQTVGSEGGVGGFFAANTKGYVDKDTLRKLHIQLPDYDNTVEIIVDGDSSQTQLLNDIGANIYDDLEENGATIYSYSTRSSYHHPNIDLVNAIIVILLMLTILIVFLSGFLITNTLQFLLTQQMQQVGIMKTIGATRKQIVSIYVTLITVFGILGFFITLPVTSLLTDNLMKYLAETINFTYSGYHNNTAVILIQIFLALIVPQLAGISPILKGADLSVQEALSGIKQQTAANEWRIEKSISKMKRFSRPVLVAIRNVFRNKGRFILTLITLSLAGAVFISVFSVRASLNNYIVQLGQYFLADLNIILSNPERVEKVEQLLYTNSDVEYVENWTSATASILNSDGSVGDNVNFSVVPNESTLVNPIMISGRWLEPEDQNAIVLNDQFKSNFPDLKVGDTITLLINHKETDWEVIGFFRLAGKLGGLSSYVNMDYFTTLPGQVQNKASIYRVVAKREMNALEQKQFAADIQELLEGKNIHVGSITTGKYITEASSNGFNILTTVLLVLAFLIALVGSIGLMGTMSMNVMDRTREIGIMRSIGASDRALTKMVLIEGVIIGWLSWGLGSLLSFPISILMSNSITQAIFGSPSSFSFTITGFAIWFILVTALSVFSSIIPARNATRLTIREVLAYE